jgi:siroheme synthase (precorrin-2 oxidase/ferrochelatase)
MIKDKIINALPLEMQNAVDFNKIFSDSLFDDLETEYLQDKFIEEFRCNWRYNKMGYLN